MRLNSVRWNERDLEAKFGIWQDKALRSKRVAVLLCRGKLSFASVYIVHIVSQILNEILYPVHNIANAESFERLHENNDECTCK